ncbi:MAG: alpha/beta fold hydrolase [Candidatus Velthaea sp.]
MKPSKQMTVALGDGASTHVDQWGEGGPVLLAVHGITSSRKSWARFAQRFAADYRVVAYDQRAHGDSANVQGPMTLERSLFDLNAVVAALGAPVHGLLGHSWGGAVAILGGRRIACDRVVAIDPMIHQAAGTWYSEFVDDLRTLFSTPSKDRERVIRDHYADAGWPAIEVDAKVHAMRSMTLDPIIALGEENGVDEGKWDLRPALRDYPKPLLLALADPADSVVAETDRTFVRESGGPNVKVEIFTGEGHSLQRSAFDKFAALTATFLR